MEIDTLYNESCLEVLKRLEDNSVDAIVTDAPYNLGFMSKKWDKTGIAFSLELWKECLRVIKPGGNLLSFGGTRTYHRMVCAIEDAGFEIRDCIMWVYGSGFPKSLDISKAIDKKAGAEREKVWKRYTPNTMAGAYDQRPWLDKARKNGGRMIDVTTPVTPEAEQWEGYGTGLKPAYEPICLARKPISEKTIAENCLKWGVGGLNIDATRIPFVNDADKGDVNRFTQAWSTENSNDGWKRPCHKDYIKYPVGNKGARFPANFIHDGSQEVMELFPDSKTGSHKPHRQGSRQGFNTCELNTFENIGDSGSAARFFYCAKSSHSERNNGCEDLYWRKSNGDYIQIGLVEYEALGIEEDCIEIETGKRPSLRTQGNIHATVKPLALMEYLVKLVTRPDHIALDPFIGSGTTAMACVKLGRHYIGCELDKGYCDIAVKRIDKAKAEIKTT